MKPVYVHQRPDNGADACPRRRRLPSPLRADAVRALSGARFLRRSATAALLAASAVAWLGASVGCAPLQRGTPLASTPAVPVDPYARNRESSERSEPVTVANAPSHIAPAAQTDSPGVLSGGQPQAEPAGGSPRDRSQAPSPLTVRGQTPPTGASPYGQSPYGQHGAGATAQQGASPYQPYAPSPYGQVGAGPAGGGQTPVPIGGGQTPVPIGGAPSAGQSGYGQTPVPIGGAPSGTAGAYPGSYGQDASSRGAYGQAVYQPGATGAASGQAPAISGPGTVQPVQFLPQGQNNLFLPPPPAGLIPGVTDPAGLLGPGGPTVPLNINVAETRTGRFMFGAGVNSDLGVTGQISIDERNFDIWRPPRSWDDLWSGRAWRGGGQGLRIEAMPGSQVQRYMASLTEPYLFDTNVSLTLSGYYFDRRYDDWDEQRLGGRVGLGYRLTPDLSISTAVRMENVNIHDPTVLVPELAEALGDNSLFSGRTTLAHDTRDTPFFPTEGHYVELGYEQVFGSFDYPRFNAELRKYFLLHERPDGSGRHTLAYSFRVGMSGDEQPIYENYFAGGFSTMRGFDFRGASPNDSGVQVGGAFQMLGSMEYLFPLTADDMVKGVMFVDFGTVEEQIEINVEDYRVAPGFGLRIAIPALGPAPLALDFAVPIAREDTDDIQNFSFYFGMGRN